MNKRTNKHILTVLLGGLLPIFGMAQTGKGLVISNKAPVVRTDELVVLKRSDLEKKLGRLPKFIQLKTRGKDVALQFDDLNGDGRWDEAVFLYSFGARESVTFTLLAAAAPKTVDRQRAHIRLRKKNADDSWGPNLKGEEMPLRNPATDFSKQPLPLYLTEGPAWENDKVGFRLYFDVRNGKDIWGKRTGRMVLDSVGTRVEPSYHNLNDWGMDVLKVGPSLGAGGLALLLRQGDKDTLMRLGGQHITRTRYEQVSDGPIRAVFRLYYDWVVKGSPVSLMEEVSIWGGQYFYESTVHLLGAPTGTQIVSGIPNLYANQFQVFQVGKSAVLLTHGKQSENKDCLGMALVVPKAQLAFVGTAPASGSDVMNAYLVAQQIDTTNSARFRFYAGWEQSRDQFASFDSFKEVLMAETQKINNPVQVKW